MVEETEEEKNCLKEMQDLHVIIASTLKENIVKFNSLFDGGLKDFIAKKKAEEKAQKEAEEQAKRKADEKKKAEEKAKILGSIVKFKQMIG